MGFERLKYYKKEACKLTRTYIERLVINRIKNIPNMNKESREFFTGREQLLINLKNKFLHTQSIDDLVLLLRETCDRHRLYVNNNNYIIWPDEDGGIEEVNGETKIWRIRPNDNYDPLLFSYLMINLETLIYNKYISIRKYVDVDEYLDTVEDWIMQSIRHFDPKNEKRVMPGSNKKITIKSPCNFKTLATTMIGNAVINLIHKNAIQHDIKDENGERQYIIDGKIYKKSELTEEERRNAEVYKEMEYLLHPLSLDSIMDNKKHPLNYSLPTTGSELMDTMTLLKDKYKREGDLISWLIVDWQTEDSELFQNPIMIDMFKDKKNITFSNRSFKEAYETILNTDLYKEFGFEKPEVDYSQAYKRSINTLRKDVVEFELCM